ncbi:antA/AntB antirepressor family protein [Caedibacter taeniospiralis]|uniref:antA/AntB antirepressor family protein n=1 Tax=Caedibacter taeniospiralis TaxID=28907 RepID=UPI000C27C632|nr:antA/AntB antirepressor family protein [Caedibacter taeniospiralis]
MINVQEYKSFKQAVSVREPYTFLEPKAQFTNGCDRMFEYGFEENEDYILLNKFVKQDNGHGGHNKVDYFLSIDCAKEIAMLQRSDKGKQVRKYFIE